MKAIFSIIVKGFGIGIADIIPGVSGGTMALIFGIYQQLIEAIKSFDNIWLKGIIKGDPTVILHRPHFAFLLPLCLGALLALFCFTRIIPLPLLLQRYPEIIYGLFFGMICGSIIVLAQQTQIYSFRILRFAIAAIAVGHLLFTMIPTATPTTHWFIFLSGVIAICAMLMPGISGSFVLLMLKKYAYIFGAIGQLNWTVIIPFTLGMITGIITFSRILSWVLNNWYKETIAAMIGLLTASLYVIWPFQQRVYATIQGKQQMIQSLPYLPEQWTTDVNISIGVMIIGLLAVLSINYKANQRSSSSKIKP